MNRYSAFSVCVVLTLLLVPGAPLPGADSPATAQLTILHTSDLHGAVLPFNDYANRPSKQGSLAQVATLVEGIRETVDGPVLLLDSGDTLQGSPLEQFVHVRWQEPSPTIAAMNSIGYDAMAVGNHEFNFGLGVLRRAQDLADFPFLSANSLEDATGEPAFPPYKIFESGPLRVGVLGLITPNIPGWEKAENYAGLRFEAMDDAARLWVPVLREKENCDLVVVLAHTGFERDLETGEPNGTEYENFIQRLVDVPGIDLLLTGHTHEDIPPRLVRGVLVSQPRARARLLTRIDLELAESDEGWEIMSWQGENLPTGEIEADPKILEQTGPAHRRVAEALDGPVGEVTGELRVDRCRIEDCAALDLIHAIQLEASGAQLSLAALLNARAPRLPAGPVTWRWIHSFYVYPNTLVAVEVTGAQVLDVLEHTAKFYDG